MCTNLLVQIFLLNFIHAKFRIEFFFLKKNCFTKTIMFAIKAKFLNKFFNF